MDKTLLKKFLGRGIMVSPEVAEELTENDYDKTSPGNNLMLLDKNGLEKIRQKEKTITFSAAVGKKELAARDFLGYYKNKIRLLEPFIAVKLKDKTVSINKMRPGQRNTILGIVREPEENRFYLEDLAGRCVVISKAPDVRENDVIAVNGTFSGDRMFAENLVYPELPIKKEINKTDTQAKLLFGREIGKAGETIDKLFGGEVSNAGAFITSGEELTIAVLNNGVVEKTTIKTQQAKITMKIAGKRFKVQFAQLRSNESTEILSRVFSKRRYVSLEIPTLDYELNTIDEDTDIVFLGESQQPGFTNHKGYTFLAVGDNIIEVDLKTREITTADF
ncbi:MAG: hypothetical protein HY515_02665 [Candidatus Aenigmarchaeota archaeon]|nr:hypothetical protein [Candidatus Aenigmarchaeota archaeon]